MQRDLIAGNFLDQQLVNLKTLNVAVSAMKIFCKEKAAKYMLHFERPGGPGWERGCAGRGR